MDFKFKTPAEAERFGKQATKKDIAYLRYVIMILNDHYDWLKTLPDTIENFERRLDLINYQQRCREALCYAALR